MFVPASDAIVGIQLVPLAPTVRALASIADTEALFAKMTFIVDI
jgi:hypothetical protein